MCARPSLLRIVLAALLLLQWGSAFAHCLRLAPAAAELHYSICTPDGVRQVSLSDLGDQEQGEDHALASAGVCPACHSLGTALPPVGPTVSAPLAYADAPDAPPPFAPPPRILALSGQPRGPPAS
jgi:hypothetical protein